MPHLQCQVVKVTNLVYSCIVFLYVFEVPVSILPFQKKGIKEILHFPEIHVSFTAVTKYLVA